MQIAKEGEMTESSPRLNRWTESKWFTARDYLFLPWYNALGLFFLDESSGIYAVATVFIWVVCFLIEAVSAMFMSVATGGAYFLCHLIFFLGFPLCFGTISTPFVVLNNVITALRTLVMPASVKDFLLAVTTLALVAAAVAIFVYLLPIIAGSMAAFTTAASLGPEIGTLAAYTFTICLGYFVLCTEWAWHHLVGGLCDGAADLCGFPTPQDAFGTDIRSSEDVKQNRAYLKQQSQRLLQNEDGDDEVETRYTQLYHPGSVDDNGGDSEPANRGLRRSYRITDEYEATDRAFDPQAFGGSSA